MKKIICLLLTVLMVVSILTSCVGMIDNITLKKAKELLNEGSYVEAIEAIDGLNNKSAGESIREEIYEKMEQEVTDLMEGGDYVKAQKKLEKYAVLPQYDELQEYIKYETIALTCLYNIKPSMKNPNSLQLLNIYFYEPENDSAYPNVITNQSGQNGFGGYATNYTTYSVEDLSVFGSCNSLDADDLKDTTELLIALAISLVLERPKIDAKVDVTRINNVLSSGKTAKLDVEQYAKKSINNEG